MTLGKKMKLVRVENDLTQKQVAEKMSVGQVYVSQVELGKSFPTEMYIKLFCFIFGITAEELWKGVDNIVGVNKDSC